MMMMMMTMTVFYSGIGTNCTADQIVTRNDDDDVDGGYEDDDDGKDDDGTNKNSTNNNNNHSPQATRSNQKTRSTRIDLCTANTLLRRRPMMADKATSKEQDVTMMMMDGCNTRLETSDGYGDLHQGRMEDDGDGGTLMPSATGTLDRKTSQAPPTTCW
jgi:hypothetical protein